MYRGMFTVFFSIQLCLAAWAEIHEFSTPDGKTVKAEILNYNAKLGQVELKREGGKRVKVNPSIFVEADQAYIQEWNAAKAFTSSSSLKISCSDNVTEKWKEEQYKDLRDTEGNVENYLMKETKFERIVYDIEFQNMNPEPLDNIRLEYRIYYEQSKESFNKPVAQQRILGGKLDVPVIAGSKKTKVTTDDIVVFKDNINEISWTSGGNRIAGEGDVHGMRAKIYMKTASGKEFMREISDPENLSTKDFPWKEGNVSRSSPTKNRKKKK